MLEYYFTSPTRLRQLRRTILARQLDELAKHFRECGYTERSGQYMLAMIGRMGQFARMNGVQQPEQISEELIERFLNEELKEEGVHRAAANALSHLAHYLRNRGMLPPLPAEATAHDPHRALLESYRTFMGDVRGVSRVSQDTVVHGARRILEWLDRNRPGQPLAKFSGADVLDCVTEQLKQGPGHRHWKKSICYQMRSFLRFLQWKDLISTDLSRVIPKVPRYRLDVVPRHLTWDQVLRLVQSIDVYTPDGVRDKAIITLIATLGLRGGEVWRMERPWIDWKRGELRIPKNKSQKERILPLPKAVGEILSEYLLYWRPPLGSARVFLRHKAPLGDLKGNGAIVAVVRHRLKKAGIEAPSYGPHLLRHSLATHMVNSGVSIKHIADMLGHAHIDTTAIYTKVDCTSLSAVAMAFPGTGGAQ